MKRVVSLIVALVMIASMGILSVSADETKGVASYQIFVDGSDSAIVVDPATNLTAAGGFTPVPFSVEINAGAKIRIFGWNGNTAGGVSSYQYRIGDSGKKVDVNGNIAVAPAAMGVGAVIDQLLGEGYGEQCEPTALFDIEIPASEIPSGGAKIIISATTFEDTNYDVAVLNNVKGTKEPEPEQPTASAEPEQPTASAEPDPTDSDEPSDNPSDNPGTDDNTFFVILAMAVLAGGALLCIRKRTED